MLEKISDTNPDIIVITGDLIDSNHTNVDVAMKFVEGASELAPIDYVTCNQEAWSEDYSILLSHRPELIEVYSNHSINLVLSGHAHGAISYSIYRRNCCP